MRDGGLATINNHHSASLSCCMPRSPLSVFNLSPSLYLCVGFVAYEAYIEAAMQLSPPPLGQSSAHMDGCDVALAHGGICQSSQSSQSHSLLLCCCVVLRVYPYCWLWSVFYLYCSSWELDGSLICGLSPQPPHYVCINTQNTHR